MHLNRGNVRLMILVADLIAFAAIVGAGCSAVMNALFPEG